MHILRGSVFVVLSRLPGVHSFASTVNLVLDIVVNELCADLKDSARGMTETKLPHGQMCGTDPHVVDVKNVVLSSLSCIHTLASSKRCDVG